MARFTPKAKPYINAAQKDGFRLIQCRQGKHLRMMFRGPEGNDVLIFAPITPGDFRGLRNFLSTLRGPNRQRAVRAATQTTR